MRATLADLVYWRVRALSDVACGVGRARSRLVAHFVERLHYTYTQRATRGLRFADAALPSDFIRRNVWVQFCEDPLAVATVAARDVANLLWGSDYPHSEGTFPNSSATVAWLLREVSGPKREQIEWVTPQRYTALTTPLSQKDLRR